MALGATVLVALGTVVRVTGGTEVGVALGIAGRVVVGTVVRVAVRTTVLVNMGRATVAVTDFRVGVTWTEGRVRVAADVAVFVGDIVALMLERGNVFSACPVDVLSGGRSGGYCAAVGI